MNEASITKAKEFLIGFFSNIFIGIFHFGLYWLFAFLLELMDLNKNKVALLITSILLVIMIASLEFFLIRYFFKTKRYIAIGMLSSLLLPLLVTGYCSFVFNALHSL